MTHIVCVISIELLGIAIMKFDSMHLSDAVGEHPPVTQKLASLIAEEIHFGNHVVDVVDVYLLKFFVSAISSLAYERMCVLFNIAALQSALAAQQPLDTEDSLKLAAKLLQVYNPSLIA